MKAVPSTGDPPSSRSPTDTTLAGSYVRRLSPQEIVCERQQDGDPCLLEVLACTGEVCLPQEIVLGEEAHHEFMKQSGLLEGGTLFSTEMVEDEKSVQGELS